MGWIRVKDRLPNDGQKVVSAYQGVYDYRIVTFSKSSGGPPHFGGPMEMDGKGSQPATHWMPLPEPLKDSEVIDKDKPIVDQLREVLIRQVGGTRECPCCREAFIPNDSTSQEALELFKRLFGDKKE